MKLRTIILALSVIPLFTVYTQNDYTKIKKNLFTNPPWGLTKIHIIKMMQPHSPIDQTKNRLSYNYSFNGIRAKLYFRFYREGLCKLGIQPIRKGKRYRFLPYSLALRSFNRLLKFSNNHYGKPITGRRSSKLSGRFYWIQKNSRIFLRVAAKVPNSLFLIWFRIEKTEPLRGAAYWYTKMPSEILGYDAPKIRDHRTNPAFSNENFILKISDKQRLLRIYKKGSKHTLREIRILKDNLKQPIAVIIDHLPNYKGNLIRIYSYNRFYRHKEGWFRKSSYNLDSKYPYEMMKLFFKKSINMRLFFKHNLFRSSSWKKVLWFTHTPRDEKILITISKKRYQKLLRRKGYSSIQRRLFKQLFNNLDFARTITLKWDQTKDKFIKK